MAFSTAHHAANGFSIIELNDATGARVQIVPSFGASLHAFYVNGWNVIDNYADADTLRGELTQSFKSVKLSPFACRISDATYSWENQEYKIDKSPIHGLLYDVAFTIIHESADESAAVLGLSYNYKGTDPGYPFHYTCDVQYRLLPGNMLEVSTTIINQHKQAIPVMDGWHPYFITGTPVDQLELQFHSKEMVEFNEKLIPTGKVLPFKAFEHAKSMKGIALDNSFLLDFTQPAPLATLKDPVKGISIEFYPDENYPVLQVYTPPHRKSIAVENLTGAPNAFNNGMGLIRLEPGQSRKCTTTIRVKTEV